MAASPLTQLTALALLTSDILVPSAPFLAASKTCDKMLHQIVNLSLSSQVSAKNLASL